MNEQREQRRGEFDVGNHDSRSGRQRGNDRADQLGDRRANGYPPHIRADEARERRTRILGALPPMLPACAPAVPVRQRGLQRVPRRARWQAVARGVAVDPDRLPQRSRFVDVHRLVRPFMQAELHVLGDRHVWVERIVLETATSAPASAIAPAIALPMPPPPPVTKAFLPFRRNVFSTPIGSAATLATIDDDRSSAGLYGSRRRRHDASELASHLSIAASVTASMPASLATSSSLS